MIITQMTNAVRMLIATLLACVLSANANAESQLYFVHTDHLGTPQIVTDNNQNVVWKGEYTPFGEVKEVVSTLDQNVRFPGQFFDQETGLHYNYFRDYDPSLGRYVQSDPIGIMLDNPSPEMLIAEEMGIIELPYDIDPGYISHPYGYVANNPLIYKDPYGLFEETMGGILGLGAGLALVDGPFPIGDAAAAAVIVGGGIYLACSSDEKGNKEHTKGKRNSTKGKHEKGRSRNKKDRGGEKGDKHRPYRR